MRLLLQNVKGLTFFGTHGILFSTLMQCGLIHRNVTFLKNLQKFHRQHLVIGYLVRHSGKNELHELSDFL